MSRCTTSRWGIVAASLVITIWWLLSRAGNVLTGFSSTSQVSGWQLQLVLTGFCASPLPAMLMRDEKTVGEKPRGGFAGTGDMMESEYSKASIYALFYAAYAHLGPSKSDQGVEYEFTFNTWGVSPSPFPLDDPQRYGKAAYHGLATMSAVAEYQRTTNTRRLSILEIGSGTGAGANLIATEVLRGSRYTALDMSAMGTATCKRKHSVTSGPRHGNVSCIHVPTGVTTNHPIKDATGAVMASASVDVVIICETHVAAESIGPEEEAIFDEIYRVLKPGGLFLWGNALPTRVWMVAPAHLGTHGLHLVAQENVTTNAVKARDDDAARVNAFVEALRQRYWIFRNLSPQSTCSRTMELLVKNFYRHPGTALYQTMVTGFDSYYRMAFRKGERPAVWDKP